MVNVKSVIFFGKSEKNIWVLDFFNYNHWYRISKTVETDLFVEQHHSRADTTASQSNRATGQQQYSYHRLNNTKLFLQVWSNINGRMGNEPNYTHN